MIAAWSGGYSAISLLLEHSTRKPDAVVLLDGLHGSRDLSVLALQIDPIVRFARRALNDEVFMYVSHSSIDTDGYASSTEGVHFLLSAIGARPLRVEREDPLGMRLVELFSRGGFHSRGYAGGGKSDHCAHLRCIRWCCRRWNDAGKKSSRASAAIHPKDGCFARAASPRIAPLVPKWARRQRAPRLQPPLAAFVADPPRGHPVPGSCGLAVHDLLSGSLNHAPRS